MASVKISQLPAASQPLSGNELIPMVQDGVTVTTTVGATYSNPAGASLVGYAPAGIGAVATTVQTKLRETVSVKDFGAVGDGVANDTTAVDRAFTRCGITGQKLYVPAGTYLLSSTITWTITNGFEVECEVGAVFKATASLPVDNKLFQPSATSGSQKFVWRGGTLDGRLMPARVSGAPDLLYIASEFINNVTINSVTFIVNDTRAGIAGDSCLFLAAGEDYFVTGCTFQGASDLGVYLSGDNTGTKGRRAVITDNIFIECENGVGSKREFEDHIVSNNFFQNCTSGVVIGGETEPGLLTASKTVISENVLKNTTRAIEARVSDGTIVANNRIENFGFDASGTGVAESGILISGSNNCLVSGNYIAIVSGSPSANATAIRISPRTVDATTYQSEYTLIEGNTIYGAPRGIVENANSNYTVVGPNIIVNAATSTILLVGANSMQGVPMVGSTPYLVGGAGEPSLEVVRVPGSVNYVQFAGSASNTPTLATTGSSTDVNLVVLPKGAGVILLGGNVTAEALRVSKGVSGGNALQVNGAAAGSAPALVSRGADTNVDLALTPKGTGQVRFGTLTATVDVPITGYIEVKDAAGTIRKLAVIS